jgi:hypothetical protein
MSRRSMSQCGQNGRHQMDTVGIKAYGKLATSCSTTKNDIVDSEVFKTKLLLHRSYAI